MIKFLYTVIDLLRIAYSAKIRQKAPIVSTEKNLRILGNGNSLKECSFETNREYDYLVVNRHVLCDNYTELKPRYYVLADSHFFSHPEGLSILKAISDKTVWDMILFIPYGRKTRDTANTLLRSNSYITIHFYNAYNFRGYKIIAYWLYDCQLAMPRVQNVLVAAIMLGLYMKYTTIELYGVEHSWTKYLFVGDDNLVYLDNPHSYDKEKTPPKPFKDIQYKEDFPMWHILECYMYMFKSYSIIKDYMNANKIGTKIINKTPNSFIDSFDRS